MASKKAIKRQLESPKKNCECKPDCPEIIFSIALTGEPKRFAQGHAICFKKGKDHPMWNGGIQIDEYIKIWNPSHINATKSGYVKEHRMVMSDYLGKKLETLEHVHHINGNKHDNRLENLQLMTKSEHIAHHNEVPDIDKRICFRCGSDKTYIRIYKTGRRRPCKAWFLRPEGPLCSVCRDIEKYDKKRKGRKSKNNPDGKFKLKQNILNI